MKPETGSAPNGAPAGHPGRAGDPAAPWWVAGAVAGTGPAGDPIT